MDSEYQRGVRIRPGECRIFSVRESTVRLEFVHACCDTKEFEREPMLQIMILQGLFSYNIGRVRGFCCVLGKLTEYSAWATLNVRGWFQSTKSGRLDRKRSFGSIRECEKMPTGHGISIIEVVAIRPSQPVHKNQIVRPLWEKGKKFLSATQQT